MNMQEADASSFRMNDFNMYGGETNQSTGNQDKLEYWVNLDIEFHCPPPKIK